MATARPPARSLPRAPPAKPAPTRAAPPSRAPPVKSAYDAYRDEQEAAVAAGARKDSKGAVDSYKGESSSEKVCSFFTVLTTPAAGLYLVDIAVKGIGTSLAV